MNNSFNTVTIDRQALVNNYQLLSKLAGESRTLAMVKSDGYGHGQIETSQALAQAGCDLFGVAELSEGVELRESGCRGEILTFLGFDHGDVDYFFSCTLTPVVFTRTDLQALAAGSVKHNRSIEVYLKFDCGMSRLGFNPSEYHEIVEFCKSLKGLKVKGVMSHFPCSDEPDSPSNNAVYERFTSLLNNSAEGSRFEGSLANSGGLINQPQAHFGMVRTGISLYGYHPAGRQAGQAEKLGLRPVLSFHSRVLQLNHIKAGTGVSYGHTFVAERDMTLGVLPVGYSDGYFRALSGKGEVIIRGKRVKICGRVCMNLCMVDVTDITDVQEGDPVTLIGTEGSETIDADEIGQLSNTISYEVLCAIGNNNQRIYM